MEKELRELKRTLDKLPRRGPRRRRDFPPEIRVAVLGLVDRAVSSGRTSTTRCAGLIVAEHPLLAKSRDRHYERERLSFGPKPPSFGAGPKPLRPTSSRVAGRVFLPLERPLWITRDRRCGSLFDWR